jgi:hypothetical protein
MESLELKRPFQSIERHFEIVEAENQQQDAAKTSLASLITAPQYQLQRIKHHHDKLRENPVASVGASHEKAQLVSNKTHYNPHDPDARISVKPGKARKLNYHCSMSVDVSEGVISHIQADYADGRDSQYLPSIVSSLQDKLKRNHLAMTDLMADTGYSNGYNYEFLEKRNIKAWIPTFGAFKPAVDGFVYDRQNDQYTCPNGKALPFKALEYNSEGKAQKAYWTSRKDCATCQIKSKCIPKAGTKRIVKTVYEEEYQRAYLRQHSRAGKQMKCLRQGTVEPVFGSLTQYYGLHKIAVLGIEGAHKTMLMAAIAFNIKKYMKFSISKIAQQALQKAKDRLE